MTDHQDPLFISERMRMLGLYISELVLVPHVPDMTCVKSFLGMMDKVREISFLFPSENLGIGFMPSHRPGVAAAIVGSLLNSREINFPEIRVGDVVSKVKTKHI